MLECFYIAVIVVFAIDVSGFYQEITSILSGWLTDGKIRKPIEVKPFSCSLCMTFWLSILYIALKSQLTLSMTVYICLLAYMTPVIKDTLILIKEFIIKIFNLIYNKL